MSSSSGTNYYALTPLFAILYVLMPVVFGAVLAALSIVELLIRLKATR